MPKVRIKRADLEVEIEGVDAEEIKQSLKEVLAMHEQHPPTQLNSHSTSSAANPAEFLPPTSLREGTINTAIARLGGDTCKAVLEAAAAHLVLYQGLDRFTDEQWEETAKAANAWKAKWSNEKAKTKKRLVDSGFVIENSAGVYSLGQGARTDLEARLAH